MGPRLEQQIPLYWLLFLLFLVKLIKYLYFILLGRFPKVDLII